MVIPIRGKTRLGRVPGFVGLWSDCRIVEATHYSVSTVARARLWLLFRGGFNPLVCLEHVLDVPLKNKKIWRRLTIDFERSAIVPLDRTFNLLPSSKTITITV
jgi:hypothetical protein